MPSVPYGMIASDPGFEESRRRVVDTQRVSGTRCQAGLAKRAERKGVAVVCSTELQAMGLPLPPGSPSLSARSWST